MPGLVRLIRFSFYALFFVVPLIFLPATSELFEFNKIIVTYSLAVVIAFAWAGQMILSRRFIFRRSFLDLPLILFLLVQMGSAVFSIDPRSSWLGYYSRWNGGWLSLFTYSFLYWAYVSFMDRASTRRAVSWSLASAVLVSLWGILEHFGIDAHIWVQDVQTRVFSTLGQPNWMAAYLIPLILISAAHVVSAKKFNFTHILISAVLFLAFVYTKSRSGFLGLGLAAFVFAAYYTGHLYRNRSSLDSSWRHAAGLVLLLVVITLTTPNPVTEYAFGRRSLPTPGKISEPALESNINITESGSIRQIVWTGSLRIWQGSAKNFWLGSGPETFAMSYYKYRPLEHNYTSEWELLYNKAHNEFLNYLATTGLLGLAAYLILLGAMGWLLVRLVNAPPAPDRPKYLIPALLAGWLSLSVTNFWGFSVVIVQLLLFLLPAMAVVLAEPEAKSVPPSTGYTHIHILLLLSVLSAAMYLQYSVFKYWLADVQLANGQKHLKGFSLTQNPDYVLAAFDAYSNAASLNPSEPVIQSELSLAAAYLSVMSSESDSTASAGLKVLAESSAQKAIDLSPTHPNHYKSQSRMYIVLAAAEEKYYAEADAALARAARISPTDPRIPYNRYLIARYGNQPEAARLFYAEAVKLRPDFGSTPSAETP